MYRSSFSNAKWLIVLYFTIGTLFNCDDSKEYSKSCRAEPKITLQPPYLESRRRNAGDARDASFFARNSYSTDVCRFRGWWLESSFQEPYAGKYQRTDLYPIDFYSSRSFVWWLPFFVLYFIVYLFIFSYSFNRLLNRSVWNICGDEMNRQQQQMQQSQQQMSQQQQTTTQQQQQRVTRTQEHVTRQQVTGHMTG